ncbi:MAG: hypothetical protein U5L72_18005 [Bacteroidales bacterium]|nr:hypothetical protein [Bacteroidales bacterium]
MANGYFRQPASYIPICRPRCPVFVAPSMDVRYAESSRQQEGISTL